MLAASKPMSVSNSFSIGTHNETFQKKTATNSGRSRAVTIGLAAVGLDTTTERPSSSQDESRRMTPPHAAAHRTGPVPSVTRLAASLAELGLGSAVGGVDGDADPERRPVRKVKSAWRSWVEEEVVRNLRARRRVASA
jgi:hypothetical protein